MKQLYYIYYSVLAVAAILGLVYFPKHSVAIKIIAGLLVITFVAESIARPFLSFFHLTNNNPIYNIYIAIEGSAYLLFFYTILHSSLLRKVLIISELLFVLFWIKTTFFTFSLSSWNSYAAIAESLIVVVFAAAYYHQLFVSEQLVALRTHSEFWVVTGMLIYYCCSMPYLGMLEYLTKNFKELSNDLLILLNAFNIIMYSLFAYAFVCQTRIMKY